MLGVRDWVRATMRLQQSEVTPILMERDMNDVFWEILCSHPCSVGPFPCERRKEGDGMWFYRQKWGEGASDNTLGFVKFDLYENIPLNLAALGE